METDKPKSVYRRGAGDGVYLGAVLTALYFSTAYSFMIPGLGLLSLMLIVAVPALIFVLLRRTFISDCGTTAYSALWMHGIMIFLCGAAISSAIAVVHMQWFEPDLLLKQMRMLIDTYNSTDWPQAKEIAHTLQLAIDNHMLPTPINMTIDMLWLIVFTGSMLSMAISFIVKNMGYKPDK